MMLTRAMLVRAAAGASSKRAAQKAALGATRAFSGNWEYPKIEGSVAEITKQLNSIGARLSIPTAALYLTTPKINHVVREMKGKEELREVQRALLLCDAKLAYPSNFAIGTFVSSCIKLDDVATAMDFVRMAENVRHYMSNQSFVRLAKHFVKQEDQAGVHEVLHLMAAKGVAQTTKMYHFRVLNAKLQGHYDEAVAIAKQAANERQINSNVIIILLEGLEGDKLKEKLSMAKYLVDKGEVYVNPRLAQLLTGEMPKPVAPEPEVEVETEPGAESEAVEAESEAVEAEDKPAEDK